MAADAKVAFPIAQPVMNENQINKNLGHMYISACSTTEFSETS